uniref:Uncharacterized protein n=1 Tax=Triticum aestivum TaxID=4565 RepID=A0A077S6C9_WHEAT|nr:unnamed protein product [Triticum aestivum]
MMNMYEITDRVERMLLRRQKLPPAGTKRKIPEPPACPPLSSIWTTSPGEIEERAEMFHAYMSTVRENIRKLKEAFAQDDDVEQAD